jgi:putative addiction module component (TIGR02574 family)
MSEVEHLLNEAMKLSGSERAELAQRLLETVSDDVHAIDPEVAAAWRVEAHRRSEELRSGAVAPVPWEDVERLLGK